MSYILDALKKSEHERGNGSVPDVQTIHSSSLLYRKEKKPIWPYFLTIAVLLNVLVISFYIFTDRNTQPAQLKLKPLTTTTIQLPAVSKPVLAKPLLSKPMLSNSALSKPVTEQATNGQAAITPANPVSTDHLSVNYKSVNNNPISADREIAAQTEPTVVAEKIIEQADLPAAIKRTMPSIVISAHVYSTNPQQRSIVINNQFLEEGDQVIDDLILVRITPDGAILKYKGYLFHNRDVAGWK